MGRNRIKKNRITPIHYDLRLFYKKNNNRGEWRFFFRRREWCEDNSVLHRAYKKSWRNFIEKLFSLAEKKKEKKKKERNVGRGKIISFEAAMVEGEPLRW